jgi:hypothetical protein
MADRSHSEMTTSESDDKQKSQIDAKGYREESAYLVLGQRSRLYAAYRGHSCGSTCVL